MSLNDNKKTQHQINLGPPTRRKKKGFDKETNNSKEFKGSKISNEEKKKDIFGVFRINQTFERINEQEKKRTERKIQANKKFIKRYPKKEPRKDIEKKEKDENNIEEDMDIDAEENLLNKKRERKENVEYEDDEVLDEIVEPSMDEKDESVLNYNMDLLKFTGDGEKSWFDLIKEAEKGYSDLEADRAKEIPSTKQSMYSKNNLPLGTLIEAIKAGKAPVEEPERLYKWIIDDLDYFIKSPKQEDKPYKDETVQMKCIINSLLMIVHGLINQINYIKSFNMKQLLAVKKLGEDNIKLKMATQKKIGDIEKPVEKWLKEENHIESPEDKEKREERRKIKEAQKLERIERYKREKTWIEKDQWDKMSPGQKALHRFVFSDVHQNLTKEQWNSINREAKNKFMEEKVKFRQKRLIELEDLIKKDKEKGEKAKRQFMFFKFKVIDRGVVCDLRGNPFQNTQYRKRY